VPGDTVICVALTPAAVMVMVVVPPGDEGDPPPQPASGRRTTTGHNLRMPGLWHPPPLAPNDLASYGGPRY
jgi:hypothetical protein